MKKIESIHTELIGISVIILLGLIKCNVYVSGGAELV